MDKIAEALLNSGDRDAEDFSIFGEHQLSINDHYVFWLRVLQDHMIFISARSQKYKRNAEEHLQRAVNLKKAAFNNNFSEYGTYKRYNAAVIQLIENIRTFKISLLNQLTNEPGDPVVLLPPTFISHMLNELEKFRYIAHSIQVTGALPPVYSLNEHEVWLIDIAGHLGAIKDNLDDVEKIMRHQLCKHKKVFKGLHAKSIELIGYLRHQVVPRNSLDLLTSQAQVETLVYLHLVKEILDLVKEKHMLGIMDKRMLTHMIFEEIYYLKKLEESSHSYDPLQANQIEPNETSVTIIHSMNSR